MSFALFVIAVIAVIAGYQIGQCFLYIIEKHFIWGKHVSPVGLFVITVITVIASIAGIPGIVNTVFCARQTGTTDIENEWTIGVDVEGSNKGITMRVPRKLVRECTVVFVKTWLSASTSIILMIPRLHQHGEHGSERWTCTCRHGYVMFRIQIQRVTKLFHSEKKFVRNAILFWDSVFTFAHVLVFNQHARKQYRMFVFIL